MKRAIVVGASSGIGRELAKILSAHGYSMGLAARRVELLETLQGELAGPSFIQKMDVTRPEDVFQGLESLVEKLGGLDVCVINAGTGFINPGFKWEREKETIEVDVVGFSAVANYVMHVFTAQGTGHLVGISSIAALRGGAEAPAYHASKAFISNYMEGLRQKVTRAKLKIAVTDIKPGFVDTALIRGSRRMFWVATPERAAWQIYRAMERGAPHAYITRRWRWVALVLRLVPSWLYCRL